MDINTISLSDVVFIYCCIDNIELENLINGGKLIYFLMDCDKFNGNNNYLENYDVIVDEMNLA